MQPVTAAELDRQRTALDAEAALHDHLAPLGLGRWGYRVDAFPADPEDPYVAELCVLATGERAVLIGTFLGLTPNRLVTPFHRFDYSSALVRLPRLNDGGSYVLVQMRTPTSRWRHAVPRLLALLRRGRITTYDLTDAERGPGRS